MLSKLAQKKQVTGDFDLANPYRFLDRISSQIGLIWYDDSQTIYVYDNSEMKSSVVLMRSATLNTLNEFLQKTGLKSVRYPIRGEQKTNAFYISGPPAYVDLVVNAASYLDDLYKNVDLNKQQITVIKLHNTFVSDRSYFIRSQEVKVPGVGSVIESILSSDRKENISISDDKKTKLLDADVNGSNSPTLRQASGSAPDRVKVIPYPDTNSLLVKGTYEQVELIKALVEQLDIPKRHVELSLWIIDITKNALDQLGVNWQGGTNIGSSGQITLNAATSPVAGSVSTLDGTRFVAEILALSQKGVAQIVSRPIILTQDNVPSIFDHNFTFYTKLEAERAVSLESVSYGTLINVLPRFSTQGDEVEMILDIEDGQESDVGGGRVNGLPVVTRTKISTIARVPKDKSLLIGGYTLDHYTKTDNSIPFLGDLPFVGGMFSSKKEVLQQVVRVFLIQPKLLDLGSTGDPLKLTQPSMLSPDLPLKDLVDKLKRYSEERDEP